MSLILNKTMIDYVTYTTFDQNLAGNWSSVLGLRYADSIGQHKPARWENYHGIKRTLGGGSERGGGTFFIGQGEQGKGKKPHYCVWVSSALAHHYWKKLKGMEFGDFMIKAHCTRLDVQVTVKQVDEWKQIDLLCHCLERGLPADLYTSPEDGLQSVYVGSKLSDFYMVIYQKKSDEGQVFLRLECRLSNVRKPGRANFAAHRAAEADTALHNDYLDSYIRKALDRISYQELTDMFSSSLTGEKQPTSVPYEKTSNTRKWLLETVCKSLDKYLRENDGDMEVSAAFHKIASQYLPGEWHNNEQ